ncbi:MAG: hypothetical protein IJQ90_02425 [Alphaproteobacteria bacterium]|nr:hypothetical protein [Alphaproteobacteria bacterium]
MSAQNENTQDSPWQDIPLEATVLGRTILRKLGERQKRSNVLFFIGVLNRLRDERQRPSPDDKITNPLNSADAKGNGLDTAYTTVAEKRALYNRALDENAVAYTGFQEYIPLGGPGAEFNDVEYIAGLWRVQKKFPYKITNVRKKDFVLIKKLPYQEHTKFEFYSAATITWGGNGCSADIAHPDWVVAKYKTNRGIYMAYGRTIEQARAFLGIKMYDEYQDLIDAEMRPNSVLRENSR